MEALVAAPFKVCTYCRQSWTNRREFIISPEVAIIGFQPDFYIPEEGLFLFNHISSGCGTTMAIEVINFIDLYHGPIYHELNRGKEGCKGHCLNISNLEPCGANCLMNHIRELIQLFKSKAIA